MRALMVAGATAMDRAHHLGDGEASQFDARVGLLIPIIKGWMTERAQIIASQGLQVHGGMGFIEETGAAQHYRDSRILTIYEGTTAIQANDLVFRKTIRDQGAALFALLDDIDQDMTDLAGHADDKIPAMAARITEASTAARDVAAHILRGTNDPRRAAASATDFLMLMGTLCGGWMMAKSAGAAAHQLGNADCENAVFMKAKLGMADIFMTHHLPQVLARAKTILEGDVPVVSISPDWL